MYKGYNALGLSNGASVFFHSFCLNYYYTPQTASSFVETSHYLLNRVQYSHDKQQRTKCAKTFEPSSIHRVLSKREKFKKVIEKNSVGPKLGLNWSFQTGKENRNLFQFLYFVHLRSGLRYSVLNLKYSKVKISLRFRFMLFSVTTY